jgi:hypothetical protein
MTSEEDIVVLVCLLFEWKKFSRKTRIAMAAPPKALPLTPSKEFKSQLTAKIEDQLKRGMKQAAELQTAKSGRMYGEEAVSVEPLCAFRLDVSFGKELSQTPLVLYSVQSSTEVALFHYITERTAKGFSITCHNIDDAQKFTGTVSWYAFVSP